MEQIFTTTEKIKNFLSQRYIKFILGLLGMLIFVSIAYWGTLYGIQAYERYEIRKSNDEFLKKFEAFEKAYREDKYGGKTPQETYEMFVKALKSNDLELASKYYIGVDQVRIKYADFKKMADNGELAEWLEELPTWDKMREVEYKYKNEKKYEYDYIQKEDKIIKFPSQEGGFVEFKHSAGKHTAYVYFRYKEQAKIWKLNE